MKTIFFNENWTCNGKEVCLPHDAQITEICAPDESNGGHGYFPGGCYTYEKEFDVPNEWDSKDVILEFEGVYKNATVMLNGKEICFHVYGYTGFFVSLKDLKVGETNTITVIADNSKLPNSRWYSGSGIYRPVWLHVCEKGGLKPECIKISTVSYNPAVIRIQAPVEVEADIYENGDIGNVRAAGEGKDFNLHIPDAKLWSEENPNLYTAKISVGDDRMEVVFGIRMIEWSNKGLFINGKETLLRGGCIHHDNGILGAATYAESEERRIKIMKQNGFNAIRSSHNPTSKSLLDACDKLGMYVMDETFDMWYNRKNPYDYGCDWENCWKDDVSSMVNRDYNHPSVIFYSIGNEVAEPYEQKGIDAGKAQIELCHSLDNTRPVTCGVNLMILAQAAKGKGIYQDGAQTKGGGEGKEEKEGQNASLAFNIMASFIGTGMNKKGNSPKVDKLSSPFLDSLDIAGYNYGSGRYPLEEKAHPERVIFGSETFPQDIWKNWQMVKKYPYLIGDFMWTGWDYLGEVGLGAWSYNGGMPFNRPYPWRLAGTGVIDILGNPDGSCKYASTVWGLEDNPVIAVRPVNHPGVRPSKSVWRGTNAILSWSFSGCEGNKAEVEVYSDKAYVELFLNGNSLGKKKLKECKAMYKLKYTPGTLTAIAYNENGQEAGKSSISSAKGPFEVMIRPEKEAVHPGDIVYVAVNIEGSNGIVESNADKKLSVSVEGGELLAFGSANPCTKEQYHSGCFTSYYGRTLAVIRAEDKGSITVKADNGTKICQKEISVFPHILEK